VKKRTIRTGDLYRTRGDLYRTQGETYMLAQVGHNLGCLISLRDGNRWNDPVSIKDTEHITLQELRQIKKDGSFTFYKSRGQWKPTSSKPS
jgi:hypothetical protein